MHQTPKMSIAGLPYLTTMTSSTVVVQVLVARVVEFVLALWVIAGLFNHSRLLVWTFYFSCYDSDHSLKHAKTRPHTKIYTCINIHNIKHCGKGLQENRTRRQAKKITRCMFYICSHMDTRLSECVCNCVYFSMKTFPVQKVHLKNISHNFFHPQKPSVLEEWNQPRGPGNGVTVSHFKLQPQHSPLCGD